MEKQMEESNLSPRPSVSCICPTANRQGLILTAIRSFLSQTYVDSELVIVDDGKDVTPVPDSPRIRYIRLQPGDLPVGEKRNICCENAKGEIIVHFDDDDWSHPNRVTQQVERLRQSGKSVTGYSSFSYYDVFTGKAFCLTKLGYAAGTTQCYYKSYWQNHRFDSTARLEEDVKFSACAKRLGVLALVDGLQMVVVRRHCSNSWGVGCAVPGWSETAVRDLPSEFFQDITPKVSIVITTFNRPAQLQNTLLSFSTQAFKDYEVIVVDDGDDSETPVLCKKYGVRYIKIFRPTSVRYRNPSVPNNVGIRLARGDVIILQNAECKHIDQATIEKLYVAVTDKNAVFARVMGLYPDGSQHWLYVGKENQRPFFFCGAMKRCIFERLRGFDEDYVEWGCDDDDLGDRLRKDGIIFEFSDISVHHQWHPQAGIVDPRFTRKLYAQKTEEMASGRIGVVRNLNREWGDYTQLQKDNRPLRELKQPVLVTGPCKYAKDGLTIDWWDTHRR